jgi:hypothetical protein
MPYLQNNFWKRLSSLLLGLFLATSVMSQNSDTTILEGKLTREQLETFTWFKNQYNTYKPYPSVVDQLAAHPKCSILVVLGTWCSDSHELVPQLFKIADLAGWEKIELIGVDRKKQCSSMDIKPLNIEYVPVIFVYDGKRLVGKIVETTQKTLEEDLLQMFTTPVSK